MKWFYPIVFLLLWLIVQSCGVQPSITDEQEPSGVEQGTLLDAGESVRESEVDLHSSEKSTFPDAVTLEKSTKDTPATPDREYGRDTTDNRDKEVISDEPALSPEETLQNSDGSPQDSVTSQDGGAGQDNKPVQDNVAPQDGGVQVCRKWVGAVGARVQTSVLRICFL